MNAVRASAHTVTAVYARLNTCAVARGSARAMAREESGVEWVGVEWSGVEWGGWWWVGGSGWEWVVVTW